MKEDTCENGKLSEIYRMSHEKVHFRVLNNTDDLRLNFEPLVQSGQVQWSIYLNMPSDVQHSITFILK